MARVKFNVNTEYAYINNYSKSSLFHSPALGVEAWTGLRLSWDSAPLQLTVH